MTSIKMIYEDKICNSSTEVIVFDFIHTVETTFALCWQPKAGYWITTPIETLRPILPKNLNE